MTKRLHLTRVGPTKCGAVIRAALFFLRAPTPFEVLHKPDLKTFSFDLFGYTFRIFGNSIAVGVGYQRECKCGES